MTPHGPTTRNATGRLAWRTLAVLGIFALVPGLWAFTPRVGEMETPWPILRVYPHPIFLLNAVATYALALSTYVIIRRGSARSRMWNASVALVSPLALLVVLDLPAALGLVDYRALIPNTLEVFDRETAHNTFDSEFLHIHPPHDRVEGVALGDLVVWGVPAHKRYPVEYRYDGDGFRNDAEPDSGAVVVIGDSFVEGWLTPSDSTVASQLAQRLGTQVYNLGQGGFGPQQELAALKRFGLSLRPQAVIWFFYEANDLDEMQRYDRFTAAGYRDSWYDRYRRSSLLRNILFKLGELTAFAPWDSGIGRRRSCRIAARAEGLSGVQYFLFRPFPFGDTEIELLTQAQQMLTDAQALTHAAGGRFLVVLVPSKFRVYQSLCSFDPGSPLKGWQLNDMPARMAAWSDSVGVPFVDLTPTLRAAALSGVEVFFVDDTHWAPVANVLAAEAVATAMLNDRKVGPASSVGSPF